MCFYTACSIFLLYLDDVMHAFEKIRELAILDRYSSGRMEIISMGEKGNESMLYAVKKHMFVTPCHFLLYTVYSSNTIVNKTPIKIQ